MFARAAHSLTASLCPALLIAGAFALAAPAAQAQEAIQITHKNGRFEPTEVTAPANKRFVLRVRNMDAKAIEFESKTLRVEKVIAANSEASINVRATKPGRYEFFDEFNEKQARGAVVVK
jgi:hypothetical protein